VLEIVALVEERKRGGRTPGGSPLAALPIEGVYVPGISRGVKRRVLTDLNRSPLLPAPILPAMRVVHDRLSVEISRGCTRGCRFCQAGYAYRPVRERDPLVLLRYLQEEAPKTGYDEVGLLSLSAADYSCVDRLVTEAMEALAPIERFALPPLPSPGRAAGEHGPADPESSQVGFTLAPEAGNGASPPVGQQGDPRRRRPEDGRVDLRNGWQTSSSTSWSACPERRRTTSGRSGRWPAGSPRSRGGHGKRASVTVSVSAFVPKPHTRSSGAPDRPRGDPGADPPAPGRARAEPPRGVKFHSPETSALEGVFSRGDGRLPGVIARAFRNGARFDA